jgi:tetratricopeptide (TPR) repeat protein
MAKEIFTRFLDAGDPKVREVADLMSSVLSSMDKRDVAIRFQKAALERRAETFGPSHTKSRASLQIMADISRLLAQDSRLEEAEAMATEALSGLKSYNKPAGPGTLMAMRTLAFVHRSRRQIKESEKIFRQILSLQQEHRGSENIDTAVSAGDLADLYASCHRYDEAIPLYARAQHCLEKTFGPDHAMTQDFAKHLAVTTARSKQWRWSMLRKITSILQIPFRVSSLMKNKGSALLSMAKARFQELYIYEPALSYMHYIFCLDARAFMPVFQETDYPVSKR